METPPDFSARDELIDDYRSYVQKIVAILIKKMGLPSKLFDDLVAAGYLGLVEAAERYDEKLGKEFRSYAFFRIRGAVIDSLRESSEFSGRAYRYAKALQAVQQLQEEGHSRAKLTSGDASLDIARIFDYAAQGALAFRMSMSDVDEEVSSMAASNPNPEEELATRQDIAGLKELIKDLPRKERLVLEEYYFKEKSFAEIADDHEGMSKSWVCKLHSRGLGMLKQQYFKSPLAEGEG